MENPENNNQAEEPNVAYNKPLNFDEVWKMFQETDKQFKETDKKFKETDKRMKELQYLFTSQWGKLIESLVKGDLVRVLNEHGIPVHDTSERRKGNHEGTSYEFDIIARNGEEVVIVEVKTTLRPDDVKDFMEKMNHVKEWIGEFKNNTIYGAMAFLVDEAGSARMAEKRGLFIIRATGDSASIVNEKGFVPRGF